MSDFFKPNYFLTLTYPEDYPKDGKKVKGHLRHLWQMVTHRYTGAAEKGQHDDDFKVVWKLEFQQRGAPHFHCLVSSVLPMDELEAKVRHYWLSVTKNSYDICDVGVQISVIRDEFLSEVYTALYGSKKGDQNVCPAGFAACGRFWGQLGLGEERDLGRQKIHVIDESTEYTL
jgi:hypothetical protein